MQKIAVLGGGSWGTAIAKMLAEKGHDTNLWLRNEKEAQKIAEERQNEKYLPGVLLPPSIKITSDLERGISKRDLVISALPTQSVRGFILENQSLLKSVSLFCNVAKGLEAESQHRISEIFKEVLPHSKFVALSGPSHAEEVSKCMPTTVVSASKEPRLAEYVQDVFMCPYFRVYANLDLIGVELGGALKNVIALGAGIADGLGYGDNAKAAIINRGIVEIARLGEKMGGKPATFAGLSGIGDLIVTCASMHSRNRRAGILIGQGKTMEEAKKEIGMVVEGIHTSVAANALSEKWQVEMPICQNIYRVLFQSLPVEEATFKLMMRDKKYESEM